MEGSAIAVPMLNVSITVSISNLADKQHLGVLSWKVLKVAIEEDEGMDYRKIKWNVPK